MKENYQISNLLKEVKIKSIQLFFDKDFNWVLQNENLELSLEQVNQIKEIDFYLKNNLDYTFLINYKYIYGLRINLLKGVFIPQFDTEVMLEKAIELIKQNNFKNALEVGSGSGMISIVLNKKTNIEIDSFDFNPIAIELSKENNILNKTNVFFFKENLFLFKSNKKYDLIISNPPYISENDLNVDSWVKENQPKEALYSNDEGLQHIKELLSLFKNNLNNLGYLIFEFGWKQKESIEKLILDFKNQNHPFLIRYNFYKDFNNNDRFIVLKKEIQNDS